MKRGNRNNIYERGGQVELAKAMGNVARKGDKEINEGREEIKSIRKDITSSENQINNLESGIDREKKSIKDRENNIKEIKKDLGGIYKTVQDAKKQKVKFADGGKVSDNDRGETVMVIEDNVVGDLVGVDGNTAFVDFSDYGKRPSSGKKREYFDVSELKVVKYDWDKDKYYAEGGEVDRHLLFSQVYNLRDRLIDLGDDDFVNWAEKNNQNPSLLKYEFIDRLTDYHGEEVEEYAKGGEVGKTYQIKGADVTFYEDSYEEGEQDQFHSYYLGENDFPYKTKFSNKKDLFETLNDFISYADMKEEDFYVDEDTIQTSALVKHEKGSNWDEFSAPTEKEKELWKKGEMKLYSAQFVFPYEVYKKEKLEFAKGGKIVWVGDMPLDIGGREELTEEEADRLAKEWKEKGYDDVIIEDYAKGGFVKDNYWGIDKDEYEELIEEKQLEVGNYILDYNEITKEWEATDGGTYKTYKSLEDLMKDKRKDEWTEDYELSDKYGFEVLKNSKGENRKYDGTPINAKGGEVKKNEEHNTMLIGGIAGVLIGIFLGRR